MSNLKNYAQDVEQIADEQFEAFAAQPDLKGQQIYCLFSGLYKQTIKQWFLALQSEPDLDFMYLVIQEFYDIYDDLVVHRQFKPLGDIPAHWRKYHWFARRLTIRSPVSMHLLLISMGARAHVRYDLVWAIRNAADKYSAIGGTIPEPEKILPLAIGPVSAGAFWHAALDYVSLHRDQQRGWRRFILTGYRWGLYALRPIWMASLENWRRKAWRDAALPSKNNHFGNLTTVGRHDAQN